MAKTHTPPDKMPPKKKKKPATKHTKKEDEKPAATDTPHNRSSMAWRKKLKLDTDKAPKQTAVVPYTLEKKTQKTYWPSALFLNASYPNGILVNSNKKEYFAPTRGYANDKGDRTLPCLTSTEARLWCQKHAAHTAVARRFPIEVGRLLGTITLEIKQKRTKGKAKTDANAMVPESLREMEEKLRKANKKKPLVYRKKEWRDPKYVKKISAKQSTDEAAAELFGKSRPQVLKRSQEIQEQWKHIQYCEPYTETWDPNDGSYHKLGSDDEQFVTLKALQEWLAKGIKAGTLVDVHKDATRELYNGLTKIPINATDIIDELVNMANPDESESLYGVPLICAYPRMTQASKGVWKVQVGVYMNRILPEIFSCQSLHIIMSALDEGSYQISQPLSLPPLGPAVFKSAPYPKVDTSVLEDDDGDSSGSEIEIIDVDMEGGSRDELVISPFSVKGLLKLLENKGCDISNWPRIERELQGKFQLDLLLHQQHAIAWMMQMEHLKGAYGINSLLWEQRTFPDGGSYYYSPALGQIRLGSPPPHMRGGLLCDEQGLGKTVEVLGLIMATLSELKQRLDEKKRATKYESDDYFSAEEENHYVAHSTLIIVPPALLAQWLHEIEKAVGKTTLSVSMLVAQTGELKQCLPPPSTKGTQSEEDEDDWDRILASDVVLTTYDSLDKSCCSKVLQTVQWGRVVLDEMQEIRSSTTKIAKNCEKLQCDRRWMLSGTPIYQGIGDLRGELNFLRLEPFGALWEDGFFQFAVENPWATKDPHAIATLQILGLVALRRSKDMTIAKTGAGLLDLKPMTVEYVPVAQSHSERALYCWMEYLVACELELTSASKKGKQAFAPTTATMEKANTKSRVQCLRLLRELCITPMLLNGGLGATSQLRVIDQLMSRHNQREHRNSVHGQDDCGGGRRSKNQPRVMSSNMAIRFLTQFQQAARTDENFVSDLVVGGGRGVTNRDRATESPEKRYNDAKVDVASAEKALGVLTKKRAKARWHLALELITSGQYSDGRTHKFSSLWKWRRLVCAELERKSQAKAKLRKDKNLVLPTLLTRGWRPSAAFLKTDLHTKRPSFGWSHPNPLLASNIPKEVYQKELATAMRDASKRVPLAKKELESCSQKLAKLKDSMHHSKSDRTKKIKDLEAKLQLINEKMEEYKSQDAKLSLPTIVKVRERKHSHGFWNAIVQFDTKEQKELVLAACSRSMGVNISSHRSVPHIKALIDASKEKVTLAESESKVYPSSQNRKKVAVTKKELANTSTGLRMVAPSGNAKLPDMDEEISKEAGTSQAHILVSTALGAHRSLAPRNASTFIDSLSDCLGEDDDILKFKTRITNGTAVMKMLHRVVSGQVSPQVAQLSAYDTLQALSNGETETKTQCQICLGYLGEAEEDAVKASSGSKRKRGDVAITMVKCGHLFCTRCIRLHLSSTPGAGCPSCRKPFSLSSDTVLVDTNLENEKEALKKEREAAKDLVREAGKLLTESNGHLEAEMWRALWLAFDLPANVPRSGLQQFPAIPREVIQHLREATGMLPHAKARDRPPAGSVKGSGRCSKVQKLLDDLPTKERCVVFSSNKDTLLHVAEILKDDKIGHQLLYTGQTTTQSRDAVTNWESDGDGSKDEPPFPVLLVHAGAASAGLTLTAASKMFILEPFLRQEQEHQAYARCHRYSQKNKVSVKVYYTPVTVESRLLEWRKGGKSALIAANDKDAEECNFEENTEIIIHNVDSDDESSESGSEAGKKSDDDVEEDNHDVAQANFLLGLFD